MERRELEEIDRFLLSCNRSSLYAYYGLAELALGSEVDAAILKRRAWAQGQQSNPRFRAEAMFIIKQNSLIRTALIDDRDAYLSHLRSRSEQRNLESLTVFIRGAVATGVFPKATEDSIRRQGRELGLPDAVVGQQIEQALAAAGVPRTPRM